MLQRPKTSARLGQCRKASFHFLANSSASAALSLDAVGEHLVSATGRWFLPKPLTYFGRAQPTYPGTGHPSALTSRHTFRLTLIVIVSACILKAPRCSEDDVVENGAALNLPNVKASRGMCRAPFVHVPTKNQFHCQYRCYDTSCYCYFCATTTTKLTAKSTQTSNPQ